MDALAEVNSLRAQKGPADEGPAGLDDKGYIAGGLMSLYLSWLSIQVSGL